MEEKEALIILNSVEGVGFVKLKRLKENFGSFAKVSLKNEKELTGIEGISGNLARKIKGAFKNFDLKGELKLAKDNNIQIIGPEDNGYPEHLKEIYDPPYVLYVKGSIKEKDKIALAIVGSRRASYYGLTTAEKFGFNIASRGITVVSGLARGIDTSSHKGALKACGRTFAVLGSGLLNIYPKENKKLSEEISEKGAVISEFPAYTAPYKQNFPRRNRIISGLSLGVIVVEAASRSGALITCDFALEQGREVFAVPGKVDSPSSYGAHNLIKQGAKLVTSTDDVLEELGLDIALSVTENKKPVPAFVLEDKEKAVFDNLSNEPIYIDELSEQSKLTISDLSSILLKLELKGLVRQLSGKMFVRK